MFCNCVLISGRACDVERAAIISGRSIDYILKLERENLLANAEIGLLPEIIANLNDWRSAGKAYIMATDNNDCEMAAAALSRLVELADLEFRFAELGKLIPRDGRELECLYLRRVCEICSSK